jgi:predicted phosphodiesterase
MRLAVLADVHGNLHAFEAALEHVARQGVDRIVLAGDLVVGCPDTAACWRLARSLRCPMLRGNQERYVACYGTPEGDPRWRTAQYAPVQWAVSQLSDAERRAMRALPLSLRLPDVPDVLFVHASARSDRDSLTAYTPPDRLRDMFGDAPEQTIVRAHNHTCQVRLWEGRQIVTAGSVGLPLDGNPTAQYLLLERDGRGWQFAHQSVPYDVDAALRRFDETGYMAAVGPMAHLFRREVETAVYHLVPFVRAYARWQQEGLSLERAVERFLTPIDADFRDECAGGG